MAKILIVEDDTTLAGTIKQWLVHQSYEVEQVDDGNDADFRLKMYHYDAIILDWELPGMSGIEICQKFRKHGGTTPILMLTGRTAVSDKEGGLDCGADDYLTKPFDLRELGARLRAILRRGVVTQQNIMTVGKLSMDTKARRALVREINIDLVPKEFALLEFLMRHPGEVYSAEALLDRIWPSESDASAHTVQSCMHTLRKKLGKFECEYIKTVHGFGYRLEIPTGS